ncbi:hypothetical protein [Streptomyces sp. NPDC001744]|uniref:hypothetical protein n=1 Tax=Streptomyces sp. NPDC001744 TaxID=3364606 RepID=UPI0036ACFFA1
MTSENVAGAVEPSEPQPSRVVDGRLIDELVSRAQAEGLRLTGEGGLLQQLTKRLLESAPEGGITDHLGFAAPVRRHESGARTAAVGGGEGRADGSLGA